MRRSTADNRKRGQPSTGVRPTWRGTKPATSSGRGTMAAFTEGKRTVPLAGTGLGVRFPKGKSGPNFRNRPSPPGACKSGVSAPKLPYDLSSKVAEKFPKGKSCKLLYTGIASNQVLTVPSEGRFRGGMWSWRRYARRVVESADGKPAWLERQVRAVMAIALAAGRNLAPSRPSHPGHC